MNSNRESARNTRLDGEASWDKYRRRCSITCRTRRTSPLCGLDALDSAIGGDGFATPDPQRFLEAVSRATCTTYPAVGAGEDLRFEGGGIVGAALDTHNGVVHAVAFPSADVIRPNVKRRFGVQGY